MDSVILHRDHVVMLADPRLDVLIPHARHMEHKGESYMVVPHQLDEVKILRNLGYDVKPPILTRYNWGGDSPYDAQRITAALIAMNPRCFVLNAIGTGKTRAVLYAYDYLRGVGASRSMLVAAPLSTLRQTWAKEVSMVFPHLKVEVLHGTKAKRLEALARPADIYIINHDGVGVVLDALLARDDIDMLVFDELSKYKDAKTARWKDASKLSRRKARVVGMGATIVPNAPTDCYGMVKLVDMTKASESFTRFRERVMRKITDFKWVALPTAIDTVHQFMQPAVRFTRDECYELPDCQYITCTAALTDEQQQLYTRVAGECAAEIRGGSIKAVNEADRINKLTQIALGTVYNTDRDVVVLPCGPRLQVVEDLIEQSESKVIVFTPYKASLAMLAQHLAKRWSVATISGDVGVGDRERIFTAFMQAQDPHILVAHPSCMSHGLTLTAASTIVWYGPPASLEMYEQANGRITRVGQKHKQLIVNVAATKLEERVYQRLVTRSALQGLLLDLYESQEIGEYL